MKIGVIGVGVVGGACKFGFELLGHDVLVHDIALQTKIEDVLETEIAFICVPTPMGEDGSCDTTIVEEVVRTLSQLNYNGIVAIKSTVVPGTTEKLRTETGLNVCFVPEFLRERCAVTDFTENHDICIIGCNDNETYDIIKQCHGNLPEEFTKLTPTEAEFCKYFNNVYNAMLIIFANSFYEACKRVNVNYTNVKNAVIKRKHIHGNYLECNDNFRGFGGMCLPKDVSAMAGMMKDTDIDFFKNLLEENNKYKVTVFKGMRK
jgi:UDPglucose 6-dehydrogenase